MLLYAWFPSGYLEFPLVMATKFTKEWKDVVLCVETEDDFKKETSYKGLCVIEVYSKWCGPCQCTVPTLRKLHKDLVEDKGCGVQFIQAQSDEIAVLKDFKQRTKPAFLFYKKGVKVHEIDGVNTHFLKSFVEESAPSNSDMTD